VIDGEFNKQNYSFDHHNYNRKKLEPFDILDVRTDAEQN
jgi:hypothetical protein